MIASRKRPPDIITSWTGTFRAFLVVLGFSAAFKIALMILMAGETLNSDGVIYISAAQKFAQGDFAGGLSIYAMPAYPLLIAVVHTLIPDWVTAARTISLICLVGALIPLYLLTKRIFSPQAAFWACLALALAPISNHLAYLVYRGPVYVLTFSWAVWGIVRALETATPSAFLAAAGLAWVPFLFRVEGILLAVAYGVAVAIKAVMAPAQERGRYRQGLLLWLVVLACIGGIVGGTGYLTHYDGFNRIDEYGQMFDGLPQREIMSNVRHIEAQMKAVEQASPWSTGDWNFAETARHYIPVIYFMGLLSAVASALFWPYLLPLFFGMRRPWRRGSAFLLSLFGAYAFIFFIFLAARDFLEPRFLMGPVVLLYPFVGAGLARMIGAWGPELRAKAQPVLAAVCVGAALHACLGMVFEEQDNLVNRAAAWLVSSGLQSASITTNERRIPFVAGRSVLPPEEGVIVLEEDRTTPAAVGRAALDHQTELLAVKMKKREAGLFPQPDGYRRIKEFEDSRRVIEIYRHAPARPQGSFPERDSAAGAPYGAGAAGSHRVP